MSIRRQVSDSLLKTDLAPCARGDPGENLVHGWPFGETTQLPRQVLLQRLTTLVGACL
jgi:hypothetical protein